MSYSIQLLLFRIPAYYLLYFTPSKSNAVILSAVCCNP